MSSPREFFAVLGIGADQLDALRDGRRLERGERRTLLRILFRMPQLPRHQLEDWAQTAPGLDQLASDPQAFRGRAVQVRGQVRQLSTEQVPPELGHGIGFETFYRVQLETSTGRTVEVYTRTVPASWQRGLPAPTPAAATGVFLKRGADAQQSPVLLAAPRISWFPTQVDAELGVTADHVYLSRLGMDIGLFDTLRGRDRAAIGQQDRECFYQLLAALGRADARELGRRAGPGFDLPSLLQQPHLHHGELMTLEGSARRITRVVVPDRDIRQRLGIDHYYQIDLFVPLGRQQVVRLGDGANDQSHPTFVNSYPVTVCVLRLPAELLPGENLRQQVRLHAAHFRMWAYHSQFVASFDQHQLQVSPMFLAAQVTRIQPDRSANHVMQVAVAIVFLCGLLGVWLGAWRWRREDARFAKLRRQQRAQPAELPASEIGPALGPLGDADRGQQTREEKAADLGPDAPAV